MKDPGIGSLRNQIRALDLTRAQIRLTRRELLEMENQLTAQRKELILRLGALGEKYP